MKIYRYQHRETKRGPYQGDHAIEPMREEHSSAWTHPHPGDRIVKPDGSRSFEFDKYPGTEYLYGFLNRNDAANWFMGWELELESRGFELVEVDVPDRNVVISNSGKQVAFKL